MGCDVHVYRREVSFEGDWVLLKLPTYTVRSLAGHPNENLSTRFCGP